MTLLYQPKAEVKFFKTFFADPGDKTEHSECHQGHPSIGGGPSLPLPRRHSNGAGVVEGDFLGGLQQGGEYQGV